MDPDRALADEQLAGDLPVGRAGAQQGQDLVLPLREPVGPVLGRRARGRRRGQPGAGEQRVDLGQQRRGAQPLRRSRGPPPPRRPPCPAASPPAWHSAWRNRQYASSRGRSAGPPQPRRPRPSPRRWPSRGPAPARCGRCGGRRRGPRSSSVVGRDEVELARPAARSAPRPRRRRAPGTGPRRSASLRQPMTSSSVRKAVSCVSRQPLAAPRRRSGSSRPRSPSWASSSAVTVAIAATTAGSSTSRSGVGRLQARPRPGGVPHGQLQLGPLEVQVQALPLGRPGRRAVRRAPPRSARSGRAGGACWRRCTPAPHPRRARGRTPAGGRAPPARRRTPPPACPSTRRRPSGWRSCGRARRGPRRRGRARTPSRSTSRPAASPRNAAAAPRVVSASARTAVVPCSRAAATARSASRTASSNSAMMNAARARAPHTWAWHGGHLRVQRRGGLGVGGPAPAGLARPPTGSSPAAPGRWPGRQPGCRAPAAPAPAGRRRRPGRRPAARRRPPRGPGPGRRPPLRPGARTPGPAGSAPTPRRRR